MNHTPSEIFNPSRRAGYIFAFASALSNAGYYILGKFIVGKGDAVFIGGLVFLAAAVYHHLWVIFRDGLSWMRNIDRRAWKYIAWYTAFSIVAIATHWLGLSMLDAVTVSFLSRLEVPMILIISVMFLKERFKTTEALGAGLIITGTLIIKWTISFEVSAGFWIILLSAVFFALLEVIAKKAVKYAEPFHINTLRNSVICLFMISSSAVLGKAEWDIGWDVWLGIAVVAAFGPLGARMFYLYSLKHIEISKTSLVSQTAPIFLILFVLIFQNKLPTVREFIGGLFIVAGCSLIVLLRPHRKFRAHNNRVKR
ncbi:DMT family transporter [bacterium]|nr:DMT family transporter [bacterium]